MSYLFQRLVPQEALLEQSFNFNNRRTHLETQASQFLSYLDNIPFDHVVFTLESSITLDKLHSMP